MLGEENEKWVKHSTCLEYSQECSSETSVSESEEKCQHHLVSAFTDTGTNYPGRLPARASNSLWGWWGQCME